MSSRVVRAEVAELLSYLVSERLALFANPVVDDQGHVAWPVRGDGPRFLQNRGTPSINDYRWWLENGLYSAILADGALLQVSYDFAGIRLVAHRLAYIPCPFEVDRDLIATEPLVDVFDLYAAGPAMSVIPRTAIRFDFQTDQIRERPQGRPPGLPFDDE